MGWLSFLFSPGSSQKSRKGQAMSSTHEAFSLPTSSPTLHAHPDAFNPDILATPEPDSATTPAYTYPPQGGGAYGYIPALAGLRSRPPSLLPLHHDRVHTPLSSSPNCPPLARTWNRIRTWLSREIPELGDTLNYGILPQDLAQIEMQFGFALPTVVRESYLIVDGQEAESAAACPEGLFFGLTLLPLEDVLEEWRFWREVDEDVTTGANPRLQSVMQSFPPGWIRKEYSQRGWIPLITDKAGNYVGVDLNPAEGGSVGQVIVFGRDFDTKVVMWKGDGPAGWAKWLSSFAEELESGEGYEIGAGNDASEGSEDGVGYSSYFQDGHGRGQGEGGGDSSFGGLRLTGEYRGWSTLEAWADRSLRKWYESGVIAPPSMDSTETDMQTENLGIDALGYTKQESGVADDTSIFADVDDSTALEAPSLNDVTNPTRQPPPPTVAVSKPPIPLPMDLPIADDIMPPVPMESPSHGDLESGRGIGMREVPHDQETKFVSSRKAPQRKYVSENATVEYSPTSIPLPSSPPIDHSVELTPLTAAVDLSPGSQPHDFLDDSGPPLAMTLIEPTSPLSSEHHELPSMVAQRAVAEAHLRTEFTSQVATDEIEAELTPKLVADATIRLVGGGGIAGNVDAISIPPEVTHLDHETDSPDVVNVASTTSATSVDSTANKKHERKKSGLSGLKRLGNLSVLRKKDSRGSVKDTMN